MGYIVLHKFKDLKDGDHIYSVGDVYPRQGYKPSKGRIDELATSKNALEKPLIEKTSEEKEDVDADADRTVRGNE